MRRRYRGRRRRSYGGGYGGARRGGYGRRGGGYGRRGGGFFRIRSRRRQAGWRWLLAGIVAGAVATGMLYINENPLGQWAQNKTHVVARQNGEHPSAVVPTFEFYRLLAKSAHSKKLSEHVVVDSHVPALKKKILSPINRAYILRVASLPRRKDAQSLRARLRSWGGQANVMEVKVRGKTWYRVTLGPYDSEAKAIAQRGALLKRGLSARMTLAH